MRLLLKLLRPKNVPSLNRKNVPFRVLVQLYLYGKCLKTLRKWYSKYAFSDTVTISGRPGVTLTHEHRDVAFESELKRMRVHNADRMVETRNASSSHPEKMMFRPYIGYFHFSDYLCLDVDGEKVTISHGDGRSFITTVKGNLKESEAAAICAKYYFSGSRKVYPSVTPEKTPSELPRKSAAPRFSAERLPDPLPHPEQPPTVTERPPAATERPPKPAKDPGKPGGLFGGDPMLDGVPAPPEIPASAAPQPVRQLGGVSVDESF